MATVSAHAPGLAPDDVLTRSSGRLRWRTGFDTWMGWLLPLLFVVAIFPILDLVYYISSRAVPTLTWAILTNSDPTAIDALGVPIVTTFEIMVVATGLAVLLGVFGGVATAEFLSPGSAEWIRASANMLAGAPSVVVGYFGYIAFVTYFGWGLSYIAGVVTLSIFMTPYVFRTADLAFSSIPRPIREAALGSGARPSQYVVRVGAPIAFPQILTGVFLAMAIGVGETAPLVLTTTHGVIVPQTIYSPVSFLTGLIWSDFSSPANSGLQILAFQAAFLLMVIVVGLNIVVRFISARYRKRLEGLYQ
ncbi:MAG TPA: ABC transporter permease subunit [Thermoplasmata archaeon]|nr:ABC transporter permease subunit [Thermoplasmata archaeon]